MGEDTFPDRFSSYAVSSRYGRPTYRWVVHSLPDVVAPVPRLGGTDSGVATTDVVEHSSDSSEILPGSASGE
jgi:hypothetical protein